MGLFNFWNNKKAEAINFSELGDWLNKQIDARKLGQRIDSAKQELNNLLAKTRKSLDELETAQLANENIPVKEKQIMEGHRKIYLQRIRKFLDEISIPDDFSEIGHYVARFSEKLGILASETQKNHMVLIHFFQHQVSDVNQGLKSIESTLSKLQSDVDKAGIETIREAKIKLRMYQDDLAKKEKFEAELEKQTAEVDMLRNKKEKINLKLEELKKSPDYINVKELFDEKKRNEDALSAIEQELISAFAELNRPLKKYTHNTPQEKLTDRYIADPVGSLEDDSSLVIQDLLRKMLSDIDLLELKDKQLEKTKDTVHKLSREFLVDRRIKISEMKATNKDIATRINRSIVTLNIAENESWIKSLDSKIAEGDRLLARISREIEEINLEYLKQKVKEKAKEVDPDIKIID